MASELKSRHATVIYMIQTDIKVPNWSTKANIHSLSEYPAEMFLLSDAVNAVMWHEQQYNQFFILKFMH